MGWGRGKERSALAALRAKKVGRRSGRAGGDTYADAVRPGVRSFSLPQKQSYAIVDFTASQDREFFCRLLSAGAARGWLLQTCCPPAETGDPGFEPELTDPESAVLPLHQSPIAPVSVDGAGDAINIGTSVCSQAAWRA